MGVQKIQVIKPRYTSDPWYVKVSIGALATAGVLLLFTILTAIAKLIYKLGGF